MNFRKPICPRGHDKRIVGIEKNYRCRKCALLTKHNSSRLKKARKARTNPRSRRYSQRIPNLRIVRHECGVTCKQLAQMVGVCRSTIDKLERGVFKATPATTAKIVGAVRELQRQTALEELKGER